MKSLKDFFVEPVFEKQAVSKGESSYIMIEHCMSTIIVLIHELLAAASEDITSTPQPPSETMTVQDDDVAINIEGDDVAHTTAKTMVQGATSQQQDDLKVDNMLKLEHLDVST